MQSDVLGRVGNSILEIRKLAMQPDGAGVRKVADAAQPCWVGSVISIVGVRNLADAIRSLGRADCWPRRLVAELPFLDPPPEPAPLRIAHL